MYQRFILTVSLSFVSVFLCPIFSGAHEGMHVVSIPSQNTPLKPTYYVAKYDVKTHRNNSATIVITTEGDCDPNYASGGCSDLRENGECKSYYHSYCEHETLYYPLPSDKIIFDGNKRLKYIEHGHAITIASHDRYPYFPLFREWNFFFTYATLENGYSTLNLLWYIKE